jgi:hypothetical protein
MPNGINLPLALQLPDTWLREISDAGRLEPAQWAQIAKYFPEEKADEARLCIECAKGNYLRSKPDELNLLSSERGKQRKQAERIYVMLSDLNDKVRKLKGLMEAYFHSEQTLVHIELTVIRKVRVARRAKDVEAPLIDWTLEGEEAIQRPRAELEAELKQTHRAIIDELQQTIGWSDRQVDSFEWRAKRKQKQGAKGNKRLHSLVSELDTIYRYFTEHDLKRTRQETKRPRKRPDDSVDFVVAVCGIVNPDLKRKTVVNSIKQIITARKRDKKKHIIAASIIYDRGKIARHTLP